MNATNLHRVEIYALLDTVCVTTMMNDTVAKELGLCDDRSPLAIGGVNTVRSVNAQYVDDTIHGIHESKSYDLLGVPCIPRLPDGISTLPDSLNLISALTSMTSPLPLSLADDVT